MVLKGRPSSLDSSHLQPQQARLHFQALRSCGSCTPRKGGTKDQVHKDLNATVKSTQPPLACGDFTKLWTQKGRAFANPSEIALSSLAIFNPQCFIFLAAAWEGWEGEKRMEEEAC